MKKVMMDGYVTERKRRKTIDGVEFEIVTYQGEHCDEYLVREVKSGRCSLFCKGILQLSWEENNGIRKEDFIMYEHGKVQRREKWASLWKEGDHRFFCNHRSGLELVVEGDGVVYRGGFDDVESMKREGRGMEFDEKSGRVLRCGVWKNDELFQITQECESEEVMIEYAIEEGKSNRNVLNRNPVYEGGYVFDEEKREVLRHGYGCKIEGGVAVREGTWERGVLKESVELFEGWYVKREGSEVLTEVCDEVLKVEDLMAKVYNWSEWETVNKRVTELVIPSNCCNETDFSLFDVSGLKQLKSIEIGDNCFENVNEVKLIVLRELERVVIGQKCFTKKKDDSPMSSLNPYRHFCLRDCERITLLKIGRYSFADYSVCEIANTNALEVIDIGDLDPDHKCWNFYYASLELKGENNLSRSSIDLSQLQRISIGRAGFNYCNEAVFESYAAKKEVMNRLAGVGSYQSGFECPRHERP